MMTDERDVSGFDVIYGPSDWHPTAYIERHFCRQVGPEGCFGTNPNHGMSFENASEQVAKWFEEQAERWRQMSLEEWQQMNGVPSDA